MGYRDIAAMTVSTSLIARLTAAAAEEHKQKPYDGWVGAHVWELASTPGWDNAWASALAAHPDDPDYDPGNDEGVITDGMILAAVQPMDVPPEPEVEPTEPEPTPLPTDEPV